jgi:hypothetical protein
MSARSAWLVLLLLALVALPYLYAARAAGPDYVFGGFLLNPIDGNSYLAKMYQGWRGDWTFSLPYTAGPGEGGFVFLYYLFLGHLARLLNLPLIWTFHVARLIGAGLMALALYQFLIRPLGGAAAPDRPSRTGALFALALFGAGLGWLVFPFGSFISDFWVAETYPFLSAYTNPHFPLGLALLLWLLNLALGDKPSAWKLALLALLLAVVNPFGVVIALLALGGLAAWDFWLLWREPCACLGSAPACLAQAAPVDLPGGRAAAFLHALAHASQSSLRRLERSEPDPFTAGLGFAALPVARPAAGAVGGVVGGKAG